ncbi:sensor histidine kinase, partial [Pseudomonadota bacterium]
YMKELILKTLEHAKLRSENIKFDFLNINLSEIVNEILSSEKIFLKDHNITIINSLPKDITVWADSLRIKEVIKNLITNAVKYTPDTGGDIKINASKNDEIITISIQDNGIGMTKEQINRIFDEFYRADTTSHGTDSVGLGLSIAKRIIQKHEGKIWAISKGPGKGSIFYFTLKRSKDI